MQLFRYRSLTSDGHYQTGNWFGPSKQLLYSHLKKQNLQLISSKVINHKPWKIFLTSHIKAEDLIDFCVHLEQLDSIKMPLTESILLLAENSSSQPFKVILYSLHQSILEGLLLSEACSLHPKVFDSIFVQCLSVSEKIGNLSQAARHLKGHLSWKQEQQTKLRQTLRYPLILFSILFLMMLFMVTFVTPHLEDYLDLLGVKEKPLALKSLIVLTKGVQDYGYSLCFILFSFVGTITLFCRLSVTFLKKIQGIVFSVPGLGKIKKGLLIGNFLQILSILLGQKLDLLKSLEKSIDTVPNQLLQEKLSLVPDTLRKGDSLSKAFRETYLFSPFALRLIQLGEESGNLESLLEKIAKIELKNILKYLYSLLAWTQPLLIIIIGLVMIWIVTATVVPLYDSLALFDL